MTANALELISVQQIPRPRHRKLHMSQPTSLGAPHESEPKLGSPYIVRVAIQKQGTEKMCARTGFMLLWGVLLPTPMGLPGMPRAISGPWSGLWHPLGGSPRSRPGIRVGRSDWNTLAPSSRASSTGALNHVGVPDFRTVALSAANKARHAEERLRLAGLSGCGSRKNGRNSTFTRATNMWRVVNPFLFAASSRGLFHGISSGKASVDIAVAA